jgi:hypothetical protein
MANDSNARIGWDGTITSVNFHVKGGLTLVSKDGKRIKQQRR